MSNPFDNGYDDGFAGRVNRNPHRVTSFSYTDYAAGYDAGLEDRLSQEAARMDAAAEDAYFAEMSADEDAEAYGRY